jgi:hypothetical protein
MMVEGPSNDLHTHLTASMSVAAGVCIVTFSPLCSCQGAKTAPVPGN